MIYVSTDHTSEKRSIEWLSVKLQVRQRRVYSAPLRRAVRSRPCRPRTRQAIRPAAVRRPLLAPGKLAVKAAKDRRVAIRHAVHS